MGRPRSYPPRRPGVSAIRRWHPMCWSRRGEGVRVSGESLAKSIPEVLLSEEEEEPEECDDDGLKFGGARDDDCGRNMEDDGGWKRRTILSSSSR
ncbi:unnamed protein product [Linum trigynum]|uniref:Uncharacterized protein n=1 Tax=Linum trigynum TaxID=586398 RepID=A0AAV2F151_9ROSI